jgi:hypothetical protein
MILNWGMANGRIEDETQFKAAIDYLHRRNSEQRDSAD